ncbi:NAD(P)-dependent oxidoreductase [Aquimarina sp. ERC-38]|uniref:NAD(P)-dependent oxidoreductase n=1 Tax=Aquimarina sp. ERC-38 TaxID=2949996 RepID=UPI0022465587|nr:NAD(P)-dependent oxidoreductase [Aquimarina sp. ERC-38]UZO80933.1 NAD(P)-dependent oxidoreductase [Aquimarina sp. ERC-38]
MPSFGILKERKTPPDRRVVFSPSAIKKVMTLFPEASFKVEPSDIRVFSDQAYKDQGIEVTTNLTECDVLLGVKEVPIDHLIPDKKYFFFSHTIKKQPYNRKLLQAILQKNIELYDHETIVNQNNNRLIGFGYYAGVVGAYNGLRAYGLRENIFTISKANALEDQKELVKTLKQINLPPVKIIVTGKGRVGQGIRELLTAVGIEEVTKQKFLNEDFDKPVFTQLDALDYNQRKDKIQIDIQDFFQFPEEYQSTFIQFAKVSDIYMAGHFYGDGAPFIFTREDAKQPGFKLKVVADISCDVDGPVASTLRASTIENPLYGYDPKTEKEVDFDNPKAITVMAVDNLPCELPADASEGFGEMFLEYVIPAFFNKDKDGILKRARITENGKLTERFAYLQDYVDE